MEFWNFVHSMNGLHTYDFVMAILAVIMGGIAIGHTANYNKREKRNEEALEEMNSGAGEPAPEEEKV